MSPVRRRPPAEPTVQAVTGLLGRSGFIRAERKGRVVRGTGFQVSAAGSGVVRVQQHFSGSPKDPQPLLARYAEVITRAGYAVSVDAESVTVREGT